MNKPTKRKAKGRKVIRRRVRPLRFLALLIIIFAIAFVFSGGLMVFSPRTWQGVGDFLPKLEKRLPAIASDTAEELSGSDRLSRFFFLHRAVEARLDKENFVRLKDVPENLQHAILAVEDRRFYTHHGVDFESVARASLVNLQHGEIQELRDRHVQPRGDPVQRLQRRVVRVPAHDILQGGLTDTGKGGKPINRYALLHTDLLQPFRYHFAVCHPNAPLPVYR